MHTDMQSSYDRASILMDKGLYAHALPLLQKAIAEEPEHAHAHAMLGQCLQGLNRMPEALKAAREALALDPADAWVRLCLAQTLAMTEQRLEATEHAKEAHRLSPEDPDPLRVLAHLALRGGQHEQALELLDQALALESEDPELHAMRAMSLRALGRHDSADEASRTAMAQDPEETTALLSRGMICLDRGDVREAEALFRAALAQYPNEPAYRHSLLVARLAGRPVLGPVFRLLLRVRNALGTRLMLGLFILFGMCGFMHVMEPGLEQLSRFAAGLLGLYATLFILPEVLMASASWLFREQHLEGVESASLAVSAGNHALVVLVGALFWVLGPRVLWALPICLAAFVVLVGPRRSERSLRVTPRQRVTHRALSLAASLVFTVHLALGLPHVWLSLLPALYFIFTRR
ncbi:tetratricopeptide repeat protein [Archangium violaceum]|nr:tetratricopeptide repeat protein [Archangium violaceum]